MTQEDKNILIESYARGREAFLVESYICDGPSFVKDNLGLDEEKWRVIFDYLVFNHSLLFKVVKNSTDFFLENYILHGMAHVRDILDVNDDKYNLVWTMIFDFLAISKEGLQQHVIHHRDRYITTFRARGGDFVRKVLGVWNERYDEHWKAVLNLLLDGVCDEFFTQKTYDDGIMAFTYLLNGQRVHRPIEKSEILRKGLV